MQIDFDELEAICPHNGRIGCDLQVENEAVTMLDGGDDADSVECCEKQCPLNSEINVEKQNDQPTQGNTPQATRKDIALLKRVVDLVDITGSIRRNHPLVEKCREAAQRLLP